MEWNFNMGDAPRKGRIVTASKCGKLILSYWVEEGQRWNMYTKEVPPIAWHLCLAHPGVPEKPVVEKSLEDMF